MTDTFRELLLIKQKQTLQNKETTVQSYRKMSNQNTKKCPGIEVVYIYNFSLFSVNKFTVKSLQKIIKK